MPMNPEEIKTLIEEALPGAEVRVHDTVGDGDHLAAIVVSDRFQGLSRVRQHQLVYQALQGRMGRELHALALQTAVPNPAAPPAATSTDASVNA